MKKIFAVAAVVLLMAWAACERPLTQPGVSIEGDGNISLAVIATTADSVSVSVRWSAVTDPSGVLRYEWKDTTTSPIPCCVQVGSTTFLTDTFTVAKPALNQRIEHLFFVRAVDLRGNVGAYTTGRKWALVRPDVTGPRSPDSVFIDTLVVIPEQALAVGTWPRTVSITETGHTVIWVAMAISDNRFVCDTIGVSGSISADTTVSYDLMVNKWKFCSSAWDSAVARARSKIGQSAPARITDSWALALVK